MGLKLSNFLFDKIIDWLNKERAPDPFPICDYDKLRYEIKPGDVILVEGRSRVADVIRQVTQSPWTHAALYIGRLHDIDNLALRERILEVYDGEQDRPLLVESLLGHGTIISPLANYQDDHMRICRPKGISHQDAQEVIAFTLGHLGTKYDVRHIFDLFRFFLPWAILPRRWRSSLFQEQADGPVREICSSLLAKAFTSVKFPILPVIKQTTGNNIELFPGNPRLFTPKDFDYSPFFDIVKYPIFDWSAKGPLYRHLPWHEESSPPAQIVKEDNVVHLEQDDHGKTN